MRGRGPRRSFVVLVLSLLLVPASQPVGVALAPDSQCGPAPAVSFVDATPTPVLSPATTTSTIVVSGLDPVLWDVDVALFLRHSYPGDLRVTLISPAGTRVVVTQNHGGPNDDVFNGTVFDDSAAVAVSDAGYASGVVQPTLTPAQALSRFRGENPNGTWTIEIVDAFQPDAGVLDSWVLDLAAYPAGDGATALPVPLTGTTAIADNDPTGVTRSLTLPAGVAAYGRVLDAFVTLDVAHTFTSDLDITLTAPSGRVITLSSDNGGDRDNVFSPVVFRDDAATTVAGSTYVSGASVGTVSPEQPLAGLAGEAPDGTWTLRVVDDRAGDVGTLFNASLTLVTGLAGCRSLPELREIESNDPPAPPVALPIGSALPMVAVRGTLTSAGDVDRYVFDAPAGMRVMAFADPTDSRTASTAPTLVSLTLRGPGGEIIETDEGDGLGTDGSLRPGSAGAVIAGAATVAAGKHVLEVSGRGIVTSGAPYRLHVALLAPPRQFSPRPFFQELVQSYVATGSVRLGLLATSPPQVLRVANVKAGELVWLLADAAPNLGTGRPEAAPLDVILDVDTTTAFTAPRLTADMSLTTTSAAAPAAESVAFIAPADGNYFVRVRGKTPVAATVSVSAIRFPLDSGDLDVTLGMPPPPYVAGVPFEFTTTVTNASTTTMTGYFMRMGAFDLSSAVVSAPPGWTCDPPTTFYVDCQGPPVTPGQSLVFTTRVSTGPDQVVGNSDIFAAALPLSGTVTIERNMLNNERFVYPLVIERRVDFSATATVAPEVAPNGVLVYTLATASAGPSIAPDQTLTITLPIGTRFEAMVPPAGWTCPALPPLRSAGVVTCTRGATAPGVGGTFVLVASVADTVTAGTTLVTTAVVQSTAVDPAPANNTLPLATVVLAAPSDTDADRDGLDDTFETTYGLDPTVATGDQGGAGDPDGDGLSNEQEEQGGTHPRGFFRQFFAEGSTGSFFDTRLALLNTDPTASARVQLRYLRPQGAPVVEVFDLAPLTRRTIRVDEIAGLGDTPVSTVVEADARVVADRTMRWGPGGYGAHAETGVDAPGTTWYFAEGSTVGNFNLFYLLQNATAADAQVTVTYLRPAGQPPVARTYTVAANSRFNVWVDFEGAELASTDVSARIDSTVPIIAERAMYLDTQGLPFGAGHDSVGVTAPALTWQFAEGATGAFFDMFLLLANPNPTPADVQVTYRLPDGSTVTTRRTVAPDSRDNVWVDLEDARLAETAVSATVTSTNGVPIIAERAMWWPGDVSTWTEAHNSPGVTATGTRWALAEGESGGVEGYETYLLIANTSAVAGSAQVTLHYEDGTATTRTFALPADSRTSVDVASEFPEATGRRFGAVVESLGDTPAQLVVERAMYSSVGGVFWAAGSNAVGTRLR